ncbi:MAG: hypothetical protein KatS3mg085_080 [Candidatus Dojkabacteria bacterium]|nr:MAG: hypothetical protein KatS3mg085_080 [Candidatus Dojkabacteria bacterium]
MRKSTNLYSEYAHEFSQTRLSPWRGWFEILKYLKKNNLRVLDLGCGNGRFLKFLIDNNIKFSSYVGVDNSEAMLNLAKSRNYETTSSFSFFCFDLEEDNWSVLQGFSFDFVVAFGLFHHFESKISRITFFKKVENLLEKEGIFILTIWQFLKDPKLKEKIIEDLGENNYLLSFGQKGAVRFVHNTTEEELREILNNCKLKLIDEFCADGKNNNLNKYEVFKKK